MALCKGGWAKVNRVHRKRLKALKVIADKLTYLEKSTNLDVQYNGISITLPMAEIHWDPDKGGWSVYIPI